MLKDSHYENPQSLLDECLVVLDLKDLDLLQKQRDIEALKKKVTDLEEKLKEKEVQRKSFSFISVQTEEEITSEISSSRNPNSNTDEALVTDFRSQAEETLAADRSHPEKLHASRQNHLKKPSLKRRTPSKPFRSAQDAEHSEGCQWFRSVFKSLSKNTKRKKQQTKSKRVWVEKKLSSEPRRIKQIWVVKESSAHLEAKPIKDVRSVHRNQKYLREKMKVQKPQTNGCFNLQNFLTNQRSQQVSICKPKFFWVPKNFC